MSYVLLSMYIIVRTYYNCIFSKTYFLDRNLYLYSVFIKDFNHNMFNSDKFLSRKANHGKERMVKSTLTVIYYQNNYGQNINFYDFQIVSLSSYIGMCITRSYLR